MKRTTQAKLTCLDSPDKKYTQIQEVRMRDEDVKVRVPQIREDPHSLMYLSMGKC